jgi:deoxyxylulose-5-phosphate synthase
MPLLEKIKSPSDVRSLSATELQQLALEMRERIFSAVSRNGGHLASNLGVVELTLALHHVYDFGPYPAGPDRLLFDVGHQCYPHKMLTGRAGDFDRLRKKGHVSGFPSPEESPFDLFAVGHAGTAISTAVGMARGDAMVGRSKSHVVAVVGDASIVNGLSFEGLNNAGTLKRQLLIILNDNGMSISQPQGRVQPVPRADPRQHDLRGVQAVQREARPQAAEPRRSHDRARVGRAVQQREERHVERARCSRRWASSTWGRSTGTTCPDSSTSSPRSST